MAQAGFGVVAQQLGVNKNVWLDNNHLINRLLSTLSTVVIGVLQATGRHVTSKCFTSIPMLRSLERVKAIDRFEHSELYGQVKITKIKRRSQTAEERRFEQ